MNQNGDTSEDSLRVEENTEIMNLQKALRHYKTQNSHLNHFNDQLVQANRRLREDLEEINTNYVESVQVAEEAVKRRKLPQEKNEEISKQN